MNPQEWAKFTKKENPKPYKPQIANVLDWEAYYWFKKDEEAALVLREDPEAPLPSNPLVAVRAVFPADEDQAARMIERIEALVREDDPPLVNPTRFGELLRLWDRESREASVEYPRKRARRQPKKKDGGGTQDDR